VIVYSKETFPENYLDASKAWFGLNTNKGTESAKSVLKQGIDKLGNIIMLYNKLILIHVDQKEYASAIELQKEVLDFSSRKERGFLKLANLQMLQKKYIEAAKSIENAKENYNDLPNRIKGTKFMKEFYSELELKEEILKSKNLKRG
jgi:tetratricopeptide (TPR) repeat protein